MPSSSERPDWSGTASCAPASSTTRSAKSSPSSADRCRPPTRSCARSSHADFTDYIAVEDQLTGLDACLFCLGTSSVGQSETQYTQITYDYTLAAARTLHAASPALTFVYVSGQGTDSTEAGRTMWARVKGRTENALLALPMTTVMVRPGYIHPVHGARPRGTVLRILTWALYPLLRRAVPRHVTTTDALGRAMLAAARPGAATEPILDNAAINRLAAQTVTAQ